MVSDVNLHPYIPDVFSSLSQFQSWFDFSDVGKEGAESAIAEQERRNKVGRCKLDPRVESTPGFKL